LTIPISIKKESFLEEKKAFDTEMNFVNIEDLNYFNILEKFVKYKKETTCLNLSENKLNNNNLEPYLQRF
jgi:hypothetical protein